MNATTIVTNLEEQFGLIRNGSIALRALPAICNAEELVKNPPPAPNELIKGVLHQGSKLVLGGSSKSFKTWTLLDLAISVQAGALWWGFETNQSKTLYLNFELQDPFIWQRVRAIKDMKQIHDVSWLDIWNLRGYAAPLDELLPGLLSRIREAGYGLIILDPIYKALGGRNESDAGDMSELMNEVEHIAVETGAATAFGAHFAKGNASQKESIDRISGSGVFARDPDSILTLTRHEVDGAFTVDMTLRNFQPQEAFCVRWEFPLMLKDEQLDPKDLKQQKGRPKKYEASQLLGILANNQLTSGEWEKKALEKFGMKHGTFYDLKGKLVEEGTVRKVGQGKWEQCDPSPIIR